MLMQLNLLFLQEPYFKYHLVIFDGSRRWFDAGNPKLISGIKIMIATLSFGLLF